MKNLFKIIAINLLAYFTTLAFISGTSASRNLVFCKPDYINFAIVDLLIFTVLLLILVTLFKIENKALSTYFFVSFFIGIVLSINAPDIYFLNTYYNEGGFLKIISAIFFPCTVLLERVAEVLKYITGVRNLTLLLCSIMIPYFTILSVIHFTSVNFIDVIKSKLLK
ncbi:MAG: hypothetical protein RR620_07770 [Clostridium sp.]